MKCYTPLLSLFIAASQCSSTIVIPCLSAISLDLGASVAQTQYVIINFLIGASLSQLLIGTSTDYVGRKKLAVICLFTFMTSSFIAVWEHSISGLCWLRFMQGLSIGSASILGRAILRDLYDGHEFLKQNAVLSAITAITPILSPIIGLCLLDFFTWRASFLFLAILSLSVGFLWALHFKETLGNRTNPSITLLKSYVLILRTPIFLTNTLCGGFIYSAEILILSQCSLSFGCKTLLLILSCSYALSSIVAIKLIKKLGFFLVVKVGLLLAILAITLSFVCYLEGRFVEIIILPFSMFMVGAGFIYSNTAALALLPFSTTVGLASCLLSVIQNGLASLISILIGIYNGETVLVLLTLLILSMLACLAFFFSKAMPSPILGHEHW